MLHLLHRLLTSSLGTYYSHCLQHHGRTRLVFSQLHCWCPAPTYHQQLHAWLRRRTCDFAVDTSHHDLWIQNRPFIRKVRLDTSVYHIRDCCRRLQPDRRFQQPLTTGHRARRGRRRLELRRLYIWLRHGLGGSQRRLYSLPASHSLTGNRVCGDLCGSFPPALLQRDPRCSCHDGFGDEHWLCQGIFRVSSRRRAWSGFDSTPGTLWILLSRSSRPINHCQQLPKYLLCILVGAGSSLLNAARASLYLDHGGYGCVYCHIDPRLRQL